MLIPFSYFRRLFEEECRKRSGGGRQSKIFCTEVNILFILGNGFDLSLGLDTSYKSFLKHYLNNHQPTSNSLIADFKNEIWDNLNTWADLEIRLGQWLDDGKVEDRAIAIHDDLVNELSLYMKNEQERLRPQAKVREQILSNMANVSQFLWRNLDTGDVDKYISNHVNVAPHQINTITLNYTDSFERLALGEDKNEALCKANNIRFHFNNPIHLHGTVDEGIVLGVNDESQVRNKRMIRLNSIKNRFIKLSTINNVYRTGYEEQAMTGNRCSPHDLCLWNLLWCYRQTHMATDYKQGCQRQYTGNPLPSW